MSIVGMIFQKIPTILCITYILLILAVDILFQPMTRGMGEQEWIDYQERSQTDREVSQGFQYPYRVLAKMLLSCGELLVQYQRPRRTCGLTMLVSSFKTSEDSYCSTSTTYHPNRRFVRAATMLSAGP